MYQVEVKVEGVSPLLQHRFPIPDYADLNKGGKKSTGAKNYADEWKSSLYVTKDNQIYQPASHFELSMTKAAASFKVTGKRGKSYKDLVASAMFIDPLEILFGMDAPTELDTDPDKTLYLDMRPVVIMRARVVRLRPCFKPGWNLGFTINVIDDELPSEILQDILTLSGKAVGIGDYRPKFGRFKIVSFEVAK
jgi:hypothetical protein